MNIELCKHISTSKYVDLILARLFGMLERFFLLPKNCVPFLVPRSKLGSLG